MTAEVALENLRTLVDAYRKATGKPLSAVSKEIYGNGAFFDKLLFSKPNPAKPPTTISVHQIDKVVENFRRKWPENSVFPALRPLFMHRSERR